MTNRFLKNIQKSIAIILFIGAFIGCSRVADSPVKTACNNFMKGRILLKKGDSTLLKSVTEDSLYRLILLHQEYIKLLDAPVIEANLNIYAKTEEINGDCATCKMSGEEFYQIKLCKFNGQWKVVSENGQHATLAKIQEAQKKLDDYRLFLKDKPARDSVLKIVNKFFESAKLYFTEQDITELEKICDEATLSFIKRLYTNSKTKPGTKALQEEMTKPSFLVGDVFFEDDDVTFKFYEEEITVLLKRKNNNFIVTGFNGMNAATINNNIIQNQYADLLRSMKLIRSEKYRPKDF